MIHRNMALNGAPYRNAREFWSLCEVGRNFEDFAPTARELWTALHDAVSAAQIVYTSEV